MALLWAASESDGFNLGGGGIEVTAGGFATGYETTYSRCAMRCGTANITHKITSIDISAITGTIWAHFYSCLDGINDLTNPMFEFHNAGGTELFRLKITASPGNIPAIQPQYWNGSAWTNIGSSFNGNTVQGGVAEFDVKLVCGGSGSFECYMNKTLVSSGSASMTSVTSITGCGWYVMRTSSTFGQLVSQCMLADQSTVGWKMYSKPPTGNSATNTAWTDDYTKVDEAILDDADFIASSNNGDIDTYTWAGVTIPAGYSVVAVAVNARVRNDGTGPVNIQAALRRSSTNYFGANIPMTGVAFGPSCTLFATDPSTGVAWTPSNAQSGSTEFGVKAVT